MKKALSFAVALGLVAGMASTAVAEDMLSINGDARIRGVYSTNTNDASDASLDKDQSMDQRYRLDANIKINDAVKINTRFVQADNDFGNNNALNHYIDRANMTISMLDGTWVFGRQEASWGNKFFGWGSSVDRVKAVYKVGDLTTAYYLQKNTEGNGVDGDGDSDTWGALVVGKSGETKWGVIANYNVSDAGASKGDNGYVLDGFFSTKAGSASVMGELLFSGGDLNDNSDEDMYFGGFVGASMPMDALSVKGLIAYYDGNEGAVGGRDCDNDFAPTLLIGTCNETAIVDFGGTTINADDSTYLVTAGVDYQVNDKLTVGALLGYLMASDEADTSVVEIDLTAKYALAQNATYSFGIAMGMPDEYSADDDDMLVIGNRIDVKW